MAIRFTHSVPLSFPTPDGEDDFEITVLLHCVGTPGRPARIRFDEHDHPAEGAEIELDRFEIYDTWSRRWRKPNLDKNDFLNDCQIAAAVDDWIADHSDELVEALTGAEDDGYDPDLHAEMRAEARRAAMEG